VLPYKRIMLQKYVILLIVMVFCMNYYVDNKLIKADTNFYYTGYITRQFFANLKKLD